MSIENSHVYPPYNMHQAAIPSLVSPHPHIDETSRLPLAPNLFDTHLPWYVPMSWPDEKEAGTMPLYNRIMPERHGRSADLTHDPNGHERMRIVFGDEFGNWYSALNVKGNNTHEPHARHTPSLHPQWDIRGHMSDKYRMRCERTSRLFRAHDIDTEWPVYMKRPAHHILPDLQEPTTKAHLISYATTHLEPDQRQPEGANAESAASVLGNFEPVVLVRALKMSERLWDVDSLSEADLRSSVLEAIRLHQFDLARRKAHNTYDQQQVGPEIKPTLSEEEQVYIYLNNVLPRRIGRNVGRMHKLGIYHHYLHAGNITLFGEIVDLDSPTGHAAMGSGPDATLQERISDIKSLRMRRATYLPLLLGCDDRVDHFRQEFSDSYCLARGLDPAGIEAAFVADAIGAETDWSRHLTIAQYDRYFTLAKDALIYARDHLGDEQLRISIDEDETMQIEIGDLLDVTELMFEEFWQQSGAATHFQTLGSELGRTSHEPQQIPEFVARVKAKLMNQLTTTMSEYATQAMLVLSKRLADDCDPSQSANTGSSV